MNDTISRQAAVDAFDGIKVEEEYCTDYEIGYNDGIDLAVSMLSVLPSAQPERKTGQWVEDIDLFIAGHCSICGWKAFYFETNVFGMPYCPNCGAKMEENNDKRRSG